LPEEQERALFGEGLKACAPASRNQRRIVENEKEFQGRVQKIGELVQELDTIGDPAVRARAKELVQSLLELHGAGLERVLELLFRREGGAQVIDELGRDPLVSSLLILYELHPEELHTRVERKLEQIESKLRRAGAVAELIATDNGNVRVQVKIDQHACGSTARTVQAMIEDAIYEAAPDLKSIAIDGLEKPSSSGFVALGTLQASAASLPDSAAEAQGTYPLSEGMD
jgi:Fe-S cluster biogenesis protein NfuA